MVEQPERLRTGRRKRFGNPTSKIRAGSAISAQFERRIVEILSMRELRIQHAGRPYRVLYAFDPRRAAILLIGGDKTGNDRWYETYVPVADRLYADHLKQLKKEKRTKNG